MLVINIINFALVNLMLSVSIDENYQANSDIEILFITKGTGNTLSVNLEFFVA